MQNENSMNKEIRIMGETVGVLLTLFVPFYWLVKFYESRKIISKHTNALFKAKIATILKCILTTVMLIAIIHITVMYNREFEIARVAAYNGVCEHMDDDKVEMFREEFLTTNMGLFVLYISVILIFWIVAIVFSYLAAFQIRKEIEQSKNIDISNDDKYEVAKLSGSMFASIPLYTIFSLFFYAGKLSKKSHNLLMVLNGLLIIAAFTFGFTLYYSEQLVFIYLIAIFGIITCFCFNIYFDNHIKEK